MKVTIIIPVHNSEKYLRECIGSAMAQTYREIEVLCIDDESTDNSFEIIQELQKKDSRIKYIKSSMSGYGHKINIGIQKASGEYIAILETDDRMAFDMIEQLSEIAKQYNVDIADADYYQMGSYKHREYFNVVNKFSNAELYGRRLSYVDKTNKNITENGIWTALYRKEFILQNDIKLNESKGAAYQDTSFMFLTNFLAESVYHLKVPLYLYRIDNPNSSVRDNEKIFEIVGEFEYLFYELKKRDVIDADVWALYYARKYKTYYWNYRRLSDRGKKLFLNKYKDELKCDIEKGYIKRDILGESLYKYTFLLLDDEKQFITSALQNNEKNFLAKVIDILKLMENRDVVIFGAGVIGKKVFNILTQNDNRIRAICDNSFKLQGTHLKDFEIMSVQETVTAFPDAAFLILNRKHRTEMRQQLLDEGIRNENIIIFE